MNARVDQIFWEEFGNKEKTKKTFSFFLFPRRYTQSEFDENFEKGVKIGIEIGLRRGGIEGQIIELNNNAVDPKSKEFLDKFYKLAYEYSRAIQYHPDYGMLVIKRQYE